MTGWRVSEIVGRLPYASNATLLGRLDDGTPVVYKPEDGERPLWDFPFGTLAAREVLTYEVSEALGFGLVPRTVLGNGPFGRGSIQRYVDEDVEYNPAPLINDADPALWPVAVLDLVVNNADRKAGHLLKDRASGTLWCIDHGVTFHVKPKLRTVLWGFAGRRLPDPMLEALRALQDTLEAGLCDRVASMLSDREAAALVHRVGELLDHPFHAHPPDDRPALPWPVW
jgi:hypothetical protein